MFSVQQLIFANPAILLEANKTVSYGANNDIDIPGLYGLHISCLFLQTLHSSMTFCSLEFLIEVVFLLGYVSFNDEGNLDRHGSSWCSKLRGLLCYCFVREYCHKDEDLLQP